jgi:hypothetical protein
MPASDTALQNRLADSISRRVAVAIAGLLVAGAVGPVVLAGVNAPGALDALAGGWQVDLRPDPASPEYLKPMELVIAADGTVTGRFYDSEIQSGRAQVSNGRACVAFRTTDGDGDYHTSACADGARLVGQTWAEKRGFLLAWAARRQ